MDIEWTAPKDYATHEGTPVTDSTSRRLPPLNLRTLLSEEPDDWRLTSNFAENTTPVGSTPHSETLCTLDTMEFSYDELCVLQGLLKVYGHARREQNIPALRSLAYKLDICTTRFSAFTKEEREILSELVADLGFACASLTRWEPVWSKE